jgi:hypothetical protein
MLLQFREKEATEFQEDCHDSNTSLFCAWRGHCFRSSDLLFGHDEVLLCQNFFSPLHVSLLISSSSTSSCENQLENTLIDS